VQRETQRRLLTEAREGGAQPWLPRGYKHEKAGRIKRPSPPVWAPVNILLIDALRKFHAYFGPDFKVACPSGSSQKMDLNQVADELSRRLCRLFLPAADGKRPALTGSGQGSVIGDFLLFHEYFNGDDGRGHGASHQTGWTALIANILEGISIAT
jgi:hypothetical protein